MRSRMGKSEPPQGGCVLDLGFSGLIMVNRQGLGECGPAPYLEVVFITWIPFELNQENPIPSW